MGRTAWFPGHMAKGKRVLSDLAGKLDILLEVRDARAPLLTSSPIADALSSICPVAVVLAKRDLADESATGRWLSWFAASGTRCWALDLLKPKMDALRKGLTSYGPSHREVRLAVVGIPNVGKSMLLNALVGKSSASVGGIPGITRGVSWYRGRGILAVDSPGILDPRAGDAVQRGLAWLGSSKSDVIGGYEVVAMDLVEVLRSKGLWSMVERKWGVAAPPGNSAQEILEALGKHFGCLVAGGAVDLGSAGRRFVEAFSTGRLGPVTLEFPGDPPWS